MSNSKASEHLIRVTAMQKENGVSGSRDVSDQLSYLNLLNVLHM